MQIISISGLDGCGKSTQIQLLKNYLKNQGKHVFYFHVVSFSIANILLGKKNQPPGKSKAVSSAGKVSIFLRKIFLLIDVFRFKLLYAQLSKQNYAFILTDRYFYDQIVNILYLENKVEIITPSWWQNLAEKYIIKPDTAIYLEVSPEEILKRERIIEQGVEYLNKKNTLYHNLMIRWKMKIVDGKKSKDEIENKIQVLLK